MAQITIRDMYNISMQAQDAKRFTGRDGQKIEIDAIEAREGICVVAEYDEYTVPFILPAHFDVHKNPVKVGDYLNVTCPGLEQLRPLQIRNVNRVIPAKK